MELDNLFKDFPVSCDEKYVKNRVRNVFKYFEDCYWFLPPANGFGRSGIPDFVGCYKGRFFSVECKAPARSDNVSPLQRIEGVKIQQSGGVWMVVHDINTLKMLYDYLDKI